MCIGHVSFSYRGISDKIPVLITHIACNAFPTVIELISIHPYVNTELYHY